MNIESRLGDGLRALGTAGGAAVRGVADVAGWIPGPRRRVVKAVTVMRAVEDVYAFWRDFTNLPRFMPHLRRVDVLGDRHSHWSVEGPAGTSVEWDAEVTEDVPPSLIAWRSTGPTLAPNRGRVTFSQAPANWGTEVRVEMVYAAPGAGVGDVVAWLSGHGPEQQVREDLRRLKAILECGEVVQARGAARPAGRGAVAQRVTDAVGRRLRQEGRG